MPTKQGFLWLATACFLTISCGSDSSALSVQEVRQAPIVQEVQQPSTAVEQCGFFETMPGVSCDDIYDRTKQIMVSSGAYVDPPLSAVESEAENICSRENPTTYELDYYGQLVNALVGKMCPGDPSLFTKSS